MRNTAYLLLVFLSYVPVLRAQQAMNVAVLADAERAIAQAWIEAAAAAQKGGFDHLLMRAVDEARSLGATGQEILAAESHLMRRRNYDATPDGDGAKAILDATLVRVAKALEPVTKGKADAAAVERHIGLLERKLEAEPGHAATLALLQQYLATATVKKLTPISRRLLMRCRSLDPVGFKAGRYSSAEKSVAQDGSLVIRATGHPMQALVSLPSGWTPKKRWPVIVAIAGANGRCASLLEELATATKQKTYVLVVPITIGNTNDLPRTELPYPDSILERYTSAETRERRLEWDREGLATLMPEIVAHFATDERFYLCGYSGGGFLNELHLQRHPDLLAGVCLGSCNYWEFTEANAVTPPVPAIPIVVATGHDDSAGAERIFPAADRLLRVLGEQGYTNIDRKHLRGRSHEPFFDIAVETFDRSRKASGDKR